jgi:hypothetical protein
MLSIIGAKVSEVELDRGPIMSMSASGHKRTCAVQQPMSALPPIETPKADIKRDANGMSAKDIQ